MIFCQEKRWHIFEFDQRKWCLFVAAKVRIEAKEIGLDQVSNLFHQHLTSPTRVAQSVLPDVSLEIILPTCIELAIVHAWHICVRHICNRHALSRLVAQTITNHMAGKFRLVRRVIVMEWRWGWVDLSWQPKLALKYQWYRTTWWRKFQR